MDKQELIEQLADKEHASWARWMQYLFSKCKTAPFEGTNNANLLAQRDLIIPADLVEHWQHQIDTPYEHLSEREKQSDRDEVAHIIPIIEEYLKRDDNSELKIVLGFQPTEWHKIKDACEKIIGKELSNDDIINMVMLHCYGAMKDFVRQMNTPPGYSS